jgi:hypothetical protein
MLKTVTVFWTGGDTSVYDNVEKIEEDRRNEHVTGWRLYTKDGSLVAMIKHDIASRIDVSDQD